MGDVDARISVQGAHLEQLAAAEQRHPVAQALGVGEDVGGEEHGLPRRLEVQDDPRTRRRPMGSSPDIGSSRNTSSGSLISAWARPTRCIMPFENRRSGRRADASGPRAAAGPRDALAPPPAVIPKSRPA